VTDGPSLHLFGIRHHGPGSARSLLHALESLEPDIILIEGPPDADDLIALAARDDLQPPVALLVYPVDHPGRAVLYPFAHFSPEWQAIRFGLARGIPVRFMVLPQTFRLGGRGSDPPGNDPPGADAAEAVSEQADATDPLDAMALAAGYNDTERWWDHLVESRGGRDRDVFVALHEMMTAVRSAAATPALLVEQRREAWMRRSIRAARAEGFQRIAIVCGAYHTPALAEMPPAREDDALLRGLGKVRTSAAWVPWSYERLSLASGYGAGIVSPVWYELLWAGSTSPGAEWMTRVCRLLRDQDLPVSSAHAIEACLLADSLAALRGRPAPGLPEYNDAAVTVLGGGDGGSLGLVASRWHFDARLGSVPADFPAAPLQQDVAAQQKRLRLPPKAEERLLDLDLRESNDRARSHLLRRLRLLDVSWGVPVEGGVSGKGTFHEWWRVRWEPEFAISIIEASRYGHTLEAAATARVLALAGERPLDALVALLEDALFADLAAAVPPLVKALQDRTALSPDVLQLLGAIPPLTSVRRYGNVRETDVSLVDGILHGLVPRASIGLPLAAMNIDDDAARELWRLTSAAGGAIRTLNEPALFDGWLDALGRIAGNDVSHALMAGYAHRVLYDAERLSFDAVAHALARALSPASAATDAASWLEGLLAGSSALLLHDERLRGLVDGWVRQVPEEQFVQVLPLLRRTFAGFPPAERRALGERLHRGQPARDDRFEGADFDEAAARRVLPALRAIWGIE
jgi:hypothetical protein